MATQLEQQLMHPVCEEMSEFSQTKVTVVGVGQVGMACAFSILRQVIQTQSPSNVSNHITPLVITPKMYVMTIKAYLVQH